MYPFLVLHPPPIDQTLGQRLPGVTEPSGKMMCCRMKLYYANVVFETQCVHQGKTSPTFPARLF